MTVNEVYENNLQHFKTIKRYGEKAQCQCPAHDDKHASLTITKGRKCTLFYCHAGCAVDDVLKASGLEKKDTFYDVEPRSLNWKAYVEAREKRRIEAVYNYVSINGGYAFTKVRMQGKKMIYGTLVNERFTYGLGGRSRKELCAVYAPDGVQAINKAVSEGKVIFIPEGEKDTDTLNKQGYAGFSYGGVNDWTADMAQLCKGAVVYVLADNDEPGRRVANTIQSDLQGIAKSAKVIVPVPDIPKADISDYFAAGHSKAEFEQMLKQEQSSVKESVRDPKDVPMKKKKQIDLMRFHLVADNGKITGVFDAAIEDYIITNQKLFIYGGIPFLYRNGCFFPDWTRAELSTSIREKIFERLIKSTTIDRVYRLFLTDARIQKSFDEINTYPAEWICFQNGMYDPINKKMIPHDEKYCCINQVPHEYHPEMLPKAGEAIEEYLNFICDGKKDTREMLLQFMGYSMTRDTRQQKFLILTGEGGSGKSTLIKCFEMLVGQRNISNVSLTDLQQRFSSIELMGMLINSCADLEIGALTDTSMIKKLVGEDSIKGERKGKDLVFFKNYAKLIFSTNELPVIKSEKTNAFYRRLLVFPMSKVPEHKDPDLFHKLEVEKDYLLMLAVQALERMYQQKNITVAAASEHEIERLRADSDSVEGFILEECEKVDGYREERTELYKRYSVFCEENERQSLTKNNFYKSLRLKGYSEVTSIGKRYFLGLKSAPENCTNDGFIQITQEQLKDLPFD